MGRRDELLLELTAMAALCSLGAVHALNQAGAANESLSEKMRTDSANAAEFAGRLIGALQLAFADDVDGAEAAMVVLDEKAKAMV